MKSLRGILCTAALIIYSVPAIGKDLDETPDEPPGRALVFTGFDFTSQRSYTGYLGGNFAPWGDLETSGFRFSLFGAAGSYRYDTTVGTTSTAIKGLFETSDFLIGYGSNRDNFSANFMVGLNVQNQVLSQPDPNNPVQGTRAGLKVQGDFYANPTPQLMLFGLGQYSTAFQSYYSEFKFGYALFGLREVFFGPHLLVEGNQQYEQWRVGGHVTGFKIGSVEAGLAGGYLVDTRNGPGLYGMVNLDIKFN
jgi:Cellulose biosynthesis protein BcsS